MRLAIKPFVGLEVVIPKRFPKRKIPSILLQHQTWITDQLAKHQHSLKPAQLPHSINLLFTDSSFDIQYIESEKNFVLENHNQLLIHIKSDAMAISLLSKWIRNTAKRVLPDMLNQIANEFGFNFRKVSIRSQKSRWGSCSSRGTISLNDQLLFFPAQTVRYLMIHELCHTRHMNHSKQFWSLVEACCPDYCLHEKQLSNGRKVIPAWFLQNLYALGRH